MNERIPTVKVKDGDSYRIINEADFNAEGSNYELYAEKGYGQPTDASVPGDGRNTDGTFSEPTPSDIRYPDMTQTEFANNHGAFLAASAAELRERAGLPDAPGGLAPDPDFVPGGVAVTKAVETGEVTDAAAILSGEPSSASKAAEKQAAYDAAKAKDAVEKAAKKAEADAQAEADAKATAAKK